MAESGGAVENPVVSVIIPVYNLEAYVIKAADSVLCQSFQDFELILVDDSSEDRSAEKCRIIADKNHDRVRFIECLHGGVSAARNRGLSEASGRYVMFLDGDDYILPEALKNLAKTLKEEKADLLYFDFLKADASEKIGESVADSMPDVIKMTREAVEEQKLRDKTIPCVCACYRRELLLEHRICFDEEQFYVEDALFFFRALQVSEKIFYFPEACYAYVQRNMSATHLKTITAAVSENEYRGWIKIGSLLTQNHESRSLYRRWLVWARRSYLKHLLKELLGIK